MKEYKVCITEILNKVVTLKADSLEQAHEIVLEQYENEEIILDYNDFSHSEIEVIEEVEIKEN